MLSSSLRRADLLVVVLPQLLAYGSRREPPDSVKESIHDGESGGNAVEISENN
jgi:hypothetical protein